MAACPNLTASIERHSGSRVRVPACQNEGYGFQSCRVSVLVRAVDCVCAFWTQVLIPASACLLNANHESCGADSNLGVMPLIVLPTYCNHKSRVYLLEQPSNAREAGWRPCCSSLVFQVGMYVHQLWSCVKRKWARGRLDLYHCGWGLGPAELLL